MVYNPLENFTNRQGVPSIATIEENVQDFSKQELLDYFSYDPWLQNIVLNVWEYKTGAQKLESYPWNITLPIADLCNARCTFCTSWLAGSNFLKLEQVSRYDEVLPYAYHFGYQGHGEPLANPHIRELFEYFADRLDKRCFTYIITNGVFLDKLMGDIISANINMINVSLNAASSSVHDIVMGLGGDAFDTIINSLKKVRDLTDGRTGFTISMVLTADNIHEAADFVRLGNDLGAATVYLRTLATQNTIPAGLNYHLLAPRLHSEFEKHKAETLDAIALSGVRVEAQPETWGNDSVNSEVRAKIEESPPKLHDRKTAIKDKGIREQYAKALEEQSSGSGEFIKYVDDLVDNPYARVTPLSCRFIYYNLISTILTWRLTPCCYMRQPPGYNDLILQNDRPFHDFWNSSSYLEIRRRLQEGPLYQACALCPMQG